MHPPADQLLARLATDLSEALGTELSGLYLHGSLVGGDFHPGRSDVDLVAVLATDPDEHTLAVLTEVHASLVAAAPEWVDHVEVDYITADAVRDVLAGREPRPMVRISPGEPIHLTPATSHYLLNWHSARGGRALRGPAPDTVLPDIPAHQRQRVVLDHLRQWPEWVQEMDRPGLQAYAVLAVCRAAVSVETGQQLSKRAAATYARTRWSAWSALIEWASHWWYAYGTDDEPERLDEVARFVEVVADELLRVEPPGS